MGATSQVLQRKGKLMSKDASKLKKESDEIKSDDETLEDLGKKFADKLQETVALKANEVNKSIASKIRDQVDAWDVQALNERLNREYEEKAKAKVNNECHDDEVKVEEDG